MSRSLFKVLPKVPPGGATTIAHRRCVGQSRWKSTAFGKNEKDDMSFSTLRDEIKNLSTKMDTLASKIVIGIVVGMGGLMLSLYGAAVTILQAHSSTVAGRFDGVSDKLDGVSHGFDAQDGKIDAQQVKIDFSNKKDRIW